MGRLIIFSASLLLIIGLVQLAQSADINGSSIVKSGSDLADEALLVEALAAAANQQDNKFTSYFPDAKSAHLFKLLNNAGDKRNPSIYSFGLGKRTSSRSNTLNPYSFGLGKRSSNVPNPYSFGLGKRAGSMYSFGLGKRIAPGSLYSFGLGKRPDSTAMNRFGFGLGKRNSLDEEQWMDEDYSQQPEEEMEEDEEDEDDVNDSEEFSVNKRTSKMKTAFFPSHLRSAFFGGPQPSIAAMNRRPNNIGPMKLHTVYSQSNDLPNPGKRLPVYNFGLGK